MARRVVSVVGEAGGALRASDPVLEANAYAVAEDIDLTVVLRGNGVELALRDAQVAPGELAGVPLPPSAVSQDLRGLIESGVAVHADATALAAGGLAATDLIAGVEVADDDALAAVLGDAEAVLVW